MYDFVVYADGMGNEFSSPLDLVLYQLTGDKSLLL